MFLFEQKSLRGQWFNYYWLWIRNWYKAWATKCETEHSFIPLWFKSVVKRWCYWKSEHSLRKNTHKRNDNTNLKKPSIKPHTFITSWVCKLNLDSCIFFFFFFAAFLLPLIQRNSAAAFIVWKYSKNKIMFYI